MIDAGKLTDEMAKVDGVPVRLIRPKELTGPGIGRAAAIRGVATGVSWRVHDLAREVIGA